MWFPIYYERLVLHIISLDNIVNIICCERYICYTFIHFIIHLERCCWSSGLHAEWQPCRGAGQKGVPSLAPQSGQDQSVQLVRRTNFVAAMKYFPLMTNYVLPVFRHFLRACRYICLNYIMSLVSGIPFGE